MCVKSIIFDLDGTLIDSSIGILESLSGALKSEGVEALIPITRNLIGPPLLDVVKNVTDQDDLDAINRILSKFKDLYDVDGYQKFTVYPGIVSLLDTLKDRDFNLFIATNKRSKPTRLIIDHLNWKSYFDGVYAIDDLTTPGADKSNLIDKIIQLNNLDLRKSVYVGDRVDDAYAAQMSDIGFIGVSWGFESVLNGSSYVLANSVSELLDLI